MDSILIKEDGTEEKVRPEGESWTLKELQDAVDGYIELLYLSDGRIMVMDEEGYFDNKKINAKASEIAGQRIVGPVLITDNSMIV